MLYMISPTSDDMMHYGVDHLHSKTGRGSGRYAWGSGKNPRASRQIYGNSNGVTKQTIKKRNKDSGNKSGVDIQIVTWKQNVATDKGLSKRSKFSTASNLQVVNKIAKDNVNCALCTYAMDLRERGKDVRANTKSDWQMKTGGETTDDDIATWYKTKDGKSVEVKKFSSFYTNFPDAKTLKTGSELKRRNSNIKSTLTSEGNGSYGHLLMNEIITDKNDEHYGYSISGHDAFYKIENGQVIIYDAQSAQRMPYDEYMSQLSDKHLIIYPDGYIRTDNLELSKNSVSENIALDTITADTNYSPSYKNVTKIKAVSQYNPPYISNNKEVIQYTPPYKTNAVKKVMDNSIKKVKDVSMSTTNRVTKVKDKIETAIKNIQNKITNTSPDSIIKRLKNK